jgi:hypothetical protein
MRRKVIADRITNLAALSELRDLVPGLPLLALKLGGTCCTLWQAKM